MSEDEKYVGVIEQTDEQKSRNYAFAETVATVNPVNWVAKRQPSGLNYVLGNTFWRKFPVQNQDGSGSCVAQTMVKLMGILAWLKWGVYIAFSSGHVYLRRINRKWGDGQGMVANDVYKIAQEGVTMEELMPSQNMSESQMNALFETDLHKKVNLAIGNYIFLPTGDLETVASVIQTTRKGVMTWFRFWNSEWNAVPRVLNPNPPSHHSVAGVDFTMYEGEKSIVIDESWGNTFGMNGQRIIKESFYRARNSHASYPMDFKFDGQSVPMPDKVPFTKPLIFIPIDVNTQRVLPQWVATHEAQKADVVRLQDFLKKEGLLPSNINSTGLYYTLTQRAVKAFQLKYQVAPIAELNALDGRRVGEKTIAEINKIIQTKY